MGRLLCSEILNQSIFGERVTSLEHMPILTVTDITKAFPGVVALDNISMSFDKGEVIALLGENGAGKSTLVKILSGAYTRDSGEIMLDGVALPKQYSTMEARAYGIAIIYQELSLMNELTVMENIYMCHEPRKAGIVIDFKKMARDAAIQLEKLNAGYIKASTKVKDLPLPQKQLVEISKALALDCKVLIMDEPTTSLTVDESSNLFDVISMLQSHGITVIYISHRLDEIFKICNRAIVMRDGKVVGDKRVDQCCEDDIIDMMTGKLLTINNICRKPFSADATAVLELENISDGGFINDLSLKVYENEVLGIGGLIGSKRTELFRMVCGIDKMNAGTVKIRGTTKTISTPYEAKVNGLGYLSENRKEDGLSLGLSLEENTIHCDIEQLASHGVLNWKKVHATAMEYIDKLKTKGRPKMQVMNLSGGNQQKVAISKWLFAGCHLLVFDEPTRGIDVAAKAEIHHLIRNFAAEPGNAAVVISSEVNELLAVSDRVLVMSKGKVMQELTGDEIETTNLMKHITTKGRRTI
jgi:ribose transport system ATP-binding protein